MVYASTIFESQLWNSGYDLVCGIDEVGRGCFAGPVVAGAVVFSPNSPIPEGIADSKLLKPEQRERLDKLIRKVAQFYAMAEICVEDINQFGIGKATQMAFKKAVESLKVVPDFILIDAFYIDQLDRKKQKPVKSGDKLCASIAAASIIAKVYRDNLMRKLDQVFPNYGFAKHKGYGTREHQEAIRKHGLSTLHRTSFNLKKFLVR